MVQTRELAEVQRVYEEETRKFFAIWEGRIVVRTICSFVSNVIRHTLIG